MELVQKSSVDASVNVSVGTPALVTSGNKLVMSEIKGTGDGREYVSKYIDALGNPQEFTPSLDSDQKYSLIYSVTITVQQTTIDGITYDAVACANMLNNKLKVTVAGNDAGSRTQVTLLTSYNAANPGTDVDGMMFPSSATLSHDYDLTDQAVTVYYLVRFEGAAASADDTESRPQASILITIAKAGQ